MDNAKITLNGKIEARFGWDAFPRQYSAGLIGGLMSKMEELDCDASAVFVDKSGKPISAESGKKYLNYENSSMFDSAAEHLGDNTKGDKPDDEIIEIDLDRIPVKVAAVVFTLDLFKEKKKLGNGFVQNTFIRVVNPASNEEVCRSDFRSLGSGMKLAVCGILRRTAKGWAFEPGQDAYFVGSMEEFLNKLPDVL